MFFFIYHLTHDHWNTPWTFIFFSAAASVTILALAFTVILHCCIGLNPRLNLAINSVLFALWAAGFGSLSWWASKTIFHVCDTENLIGSDETGRMVCRTYKALYSFACLGFVSTLLALVLDIYVFRQATRLGEYENMKDTDLKHTEPLYQDAGDHVLGAYNDREMPNEVKGYGLPEQQFAYDTSYQGSGHGRH